MKNCEKDSIIKILPNSWFKINKACELIANVCHNVTEVRRPVKANVVMYQGNLKMINMTKELGCKNLRKGSDQDFVKTMLILNGLRPCDEQKVGISCRNSTIFKLENGEKIFKLLMMASSAGEVYRVIDKVIFEGGRSSCLEIKTVVMKRN